MASPSLDTLLVRLHRGLEGRVSRDPEVLASVAGDESGLPSGDPGAVAWPLSTAEVALIAKEAALLGVPMVPRGAGTGKSGGCIPRGGELVVDTSRMNRLLAMHQEDLYAEVEPGLVTLAFDEAAREHGLMYPPDPASLDSCTLGGNIATNAGGARAVKYGTTRRYVFGVTLVLTGGEVLQMGRRSIKGVAGYDVTASVVGSGGTFGIITAAILHIVPAPRATETAWLSFPDLATANRAAAAIFAAGITPSMLEVLDTYALDAVRPKSAFRVPAAGCALMCETDGHEDLAFAELTRACEVALAHGGLDSQLAASEADREGMRRARRLVSSALKELYPFKLSDDVAVPRSRIAALLCEAERESSKSGVEVAAYGHIGDGNLHLNFLCATKDEREAAKELRRRLVASVVALGGTITGEHGTGLSKRDLLPLEHGPELLALERRLKHAFDPQGLMNPGKVLPDGPREL